MIDSLPSPRPELAPLGAPQTNAPRPASPSSPRQETATGDRLTLSAEGLAASADEETSTGPSDLTPEEEKQLAELRARDREVRAHEQAHKAAAGDLAVGGPTYETETGPDGREYAVGGEVQIQLREGETPEETLALAQRARRAALAPAEPSSQDRAVAAEAARMAAQAQSDMRTAEREGSPEEAAGLERRRSAYGNVAGGAAAASQLLGDLFA